MTEPAVDEAVAAIRAGGVVVLPTDTVYGLVASPYREEPTRRVYRLKGRDAWLESRNRQQRPEHLVEEVAADQVTEAAQGVELTGRVIQRWVETGEVASELPLRIEFTITDGLIRRLEFLPG